AWAVVVLSLLAASTGAVILAMMVRALKPLRDLVDVAKAIGKGSLDVRVKDAGDDEVGLLAQELNNMAQALEDRQGVLAARSQELLRLTGFAENVIRSVRVGIV